MTFGVSGSHACCGAGQYTNFYQYSRARHIELSQYISKWLGVWGIHTIVINKDQKKDWHEPLLSLGFQVLMEDIPNPSHSNQSFLTLYGLEPKNFKPVEETAKEKAEKLLKEKREKDRVAAAQQQYIQFNNNFIIRR